MRIKPPERYVTQRANTGLVTTTGWHQDNGVVHEEADNTDMLTVWLALTEATERNGCMMVVPGSYHEGLQLHCTLPNERGLKATTIPMQLIPKERVRPLPMSPGDVLFMHRRCMHASLTNHSDDVRWSFDLRYNPTGQSTGRTYLPSFVARSRANPESELRDAAAWERLWVDTHHRLMTDDVEPFRAHRWDNSHELCA